VGNIPGGGQPWSTLGGQANVNLRSGRLEFEIRGLVLAGGNSIGTPDAINQVKGTIVCGPGSATQFVADTPLVSLSAQGNAEFEGNVGPFSNRLRTHKPRISGAHRGWPLDCQRRR